MQGVPATQISYIDGYMEEYYPQWMTEENAVIGEFLLNNPWRQEDGVLLDVGCGPVPFYWGLFQPSVAKFYAIDARQESVRYVRAVVGACRGGVIEERYLAVARQLGELDPAVYVQKMAGRFEGLSVHCLGEPLPYQDDFFDEVFSGFGIDHVDTREEFRFALREALRVLRSGGCFTLVTLCETATWKCGEIVGKCLFTSLASLQADLTEAGFQVVSIEEVDAVTAVAEEQGYTKMLFCRALKA